MVWPQRKRRAKCCYRQCTAHERRLKHPWNIVRFHVLRMLSSTKHPLPGCFLNDNMGKTWNFCMFYWMLTSTTHGDGGCFSEGKHALKHPLLLCITYVFLGKTWLHWMFAFMSTLTETFTWVMFLPRLSWRKPGSSGCFLNVYIQKNIHVCHVLLQVIFQKTWHTWMFFRKKHSKNIHSSQVLAYVNFGAPGNRPRKVRVFLGIKPGAFECLYSFPKTQTQDSPQDDVMWVEVILMMSRA